MDTSFIIKVFITWGTKRFLDTLPNLKTNFPFYVSNKFLGRRNWTNVYQQFLLVIIFPRQNPIVTFCLDFATVSMLIQNLLLSHDFCLWYIHREEFTHTQYSSVAANSLRVKASPAFWCKSLKLPYQRETLFLHFLHKAQYRYSKQVPIY